MVWYSGCEPVSTVAYGARRAAPSASTSSSVTTSKAIPCLGEPVDQMRVRRVVAETGAALVEEGEIARPQGEHGAQARGVADAAAVAVAVVGGAPVLGMVVGIVRVRAPRRHPLAEARVDVAAGVIGVGLIRVGRGDEEHLGAGPSAGRPHVKGQLVDMPVRRQSHQIGATR